MVDPDTLGHGKYCQLALTGISPRIVALWQQAQHVLLPYVTKTDIQKRINGRVLPKKFKNNSTTIIFVFKYSPSFQKSHRNVTGYGKRNGISENKLYS